MSVHDRVKNYLKNYPGSTARDLSLNLELSKNLVNSTLYKSNEFTRTSNYRWFHVDDAPETETTTKKNFKLVGPTKSLQTNSVNKAIKYVKLGKVREAEKAIKPAVNYLTKIKCKKIILGCTELPIAIFAYKSFKKIKQSKIFIDPNLLIANVSMKKYKSL